MKAFYTIRELAELAGVSRKRMVKLLGAYDIEFVAAGPRYKLVPLAQIREKMKPMYDSFQMRERYERIVATID